MSEDLIHSKIELLYEQIENLEKSGFFTEEEMDRLSSPLRIELALMKLALGNSRLEVVSSSSQSIVKKFTRIMNSVFFPSPEKYGMSDESYQEGNFIHKECFSQLETVKNQEA